MDGQSGRQSLIGTLDRGLAILEFLAERGECSVGEISDSLGLSRSTAYRLVDALRERGFVSSVSGSTEIRLGMKAVEIGMAAVSRVDIFKLAPPVMRQLADTGFGTVFLAVPDGDSVVYIAKEEGPQALNLSARLGSRRPLYSTALGKAYMSALDVDEQDSLVRRLELSKLTANTITDPGRLKAELDLTRRRGYAVDNVENEEGVACVAAPVLDFRGFPIASISIAGQADQILPQKQKLGPLVIGTALTLSRQLGYVQPLHTGVLPGQDKQRAGRAR
jgi:DNA-binding IclR family transcriptional regulator